MPGGVTPHRSAFAQWWHIGADGEQQMALNRFVAGICTILFNLWAARHGLLSGYPLLAPAVYVLLGAAIGLHLLARPVPSSSRRLLALVLDCGGVAYELHIGGPATVWQFSAFLWIIFGNGFRFGSGFQIYATLVATAAFCAMAALTPYWYNQPSQVFGAFITLTLVPLYALTLIKRLSQARQDAEEASRAKSLFLASVSHELRTPLNAIIGMGALLESSDLKPGQLQMSQTVMTAARSLLSLIDGILDISRTESGRAAVANADFDLGQLLNEIRTIFVAQGQLKGVQLDVHVTARTPLLLHGDARKLHEILLNLVGNSMKFTETGSITMAVDALSQADDRLRLRFEVTDTGIGIAAEAHERIFDVFSQADETIVNRFGGTGLGLALVRKSVQLLGGEIGVRSSPGAGSTFWFELQMQQQPAQPARRFTRMRAFVLSRRVELVAPLLGQLNAWGVQVQQAEASLAEWPGADCVLAFDNMAADAGDRSFETAHAAGGLLFVNVSDSVTRGLPDAAAQRQYVSGLSLPVQDTELSRVLQLVAALTGYGGVPAAAQQHLVTAPESFSLLVADDIVTNRHVLERILGAAGHRVTLVNNGEQALDALAAGSFDAAILDVNMPVMGGIEAAKIYRMTAGGGEGVPLIALTADATAATRKHCLEAGMAACLVKPVEPAGLIAKLDEVVGKARSGAGTADPRVTEIAEHPRFRASQPPVTEAVDSEVLAGLLALGGGGFVTDVMDIFRGEARAMLTEMRTAATLGDVQGFRTHAHALRSVSANVGARQLFDLCKPFQAASASELRLRSPIWLEQIETELARVESALTDYSRGRGGQSVQVSS